MLGIRTSIRNPPYILRHKEKYHLSMLQDLSIFEYQHKSCYETVGQIYKLHRAQVKGKERIRSVVEFKKAYRLRKIH